MIMFTIFCIFVGYSFLDILRDASGFTSSFTFILCSLSNLDSALEKGGGDFGGELGSSRLRSKLVYLRNITIITIIITMIAMITMIIMVIMITMNMMNRILKVVYAYLLESPPMSESYSFSEA